MRYITDFRQTELAQGLIKKINRESRSPARLMEFCGGHTVTIFRYGIRQVLPDNIKMVSGPGCPVCVTANGDLDKAIALAQVPGLILTTFGDMLKVPGSRSSLQEAKAAGADVRIVYSTMDALQIASDNPHRPTVFLGIGFETTAPTVAASILMAKEKKLKNYFVLSLHKVCPPAIRSLLDSGEVDLQGLICPGHVSAITGSQAWDFIAKEYGIPCVVAGFEPLDILQSVEKLINQIENDRAEVEIAYSRGVNIGGNTTAQKLMNQVFKPCTADWRGIGTVPGSGLRLNSFYRDYDAENVFDIEPGPASEPAGCICGQILRGTKTPLDCPLFNKVCTPQNPIGPCMVSTEGTCSTYQLYGAGNE